MRLLIDLQGGQATNARRGIGRYSIALADAIARNRGDHDVHVLLNDRFVEQTIELRRHFADMLPASAVHTFHPLSGGEGRASHGQWRARANEALRDMVIASVEPDVVVVPSLFEGFVDAATSGVPTEATRWSTAVVVHDLIPLLHPDIYLGDPTMAAWYAQRIEHLRRADLLLANSEASRIDTITHLGRAGESIVNISGAIDPAYRNASTQSPADTAAVATRHGLHRPYVMYTGGIDPRKNVDGLIAAYAALPRQLRTQHQLAIVCSVDDASRELLLRQASDLGLGEDDVVLTGFVSDDDLRGLYHASLAFVFPSWYEGFGLPVLEAMASGRAAIASNCSSIPELIGRADAMFDPHDPASITGAIERVLTDHEFRADLERSGLERSKLFSWDNSARRALAAIEQLPPRQVPAAARPRLAYVSPLPPTPSGISDYSAELVPELTRHYDIELIVADEASLAVDHGRPTRTVAWFREHHDEFDRVLYHFGNSEFHQHMFDLIEQFPGVVVLHDFYLSGLIAYLEATGAARGAWHRALYESHGYAALRQLADEDGWSTTMWSYPTNRHVIQNADGVIVHSEHSRRLAEQWLGTGAGDDWALVPLLRTPFDSSPQARAAARAALGFGDDDFVVCSFGMTGSTKLSHRLLGAFRASSLAHAPNARLLFVGENIGGPYGREFAAGLRSLGDEARFRCTGRLDAAQFRTHLLACDLAVQLRTMSRGETSAAVLDCMNAGAPLIVNANGSTADLPAGVAHMLPDEFSDAELVEALETFRAAPERRRSLAGAAHQWLHDVHQPPWCADRYHEAIERFAARASSPSAIQRTLGVIATDAPNQHDVHELAEATARTFRPSPTERQLLVDVSELVQRDAQTGIQRVTKNVLHALLLQPPAGMRVEPVYASLEHGYRYAREFTAGLLASPPTWMQDGPIEFGPGDVFLGLDLQPWVVPHHAQSFRELRAAGVQVHFVVYDLLPMVVPQTFHPGAADQHSNWLAVVAENDGACCISAATAADLHDWLAQHSPDRRPQVGTFRLGANLPDATRSTGYHDDAVAVLAALARRPTFTMVGTIEPRKAHEQVLDGFEQLWRDGVDVNLAIVGKQGWMVEQLVDRLLTHPELGRRLQWVKGASDEYLESVYTFTDCLVAASLAEGYGLPLVEAALRRIPVLARDIPVFREVAGEHAQYFTGEGPEVIAAAVTDWLRRREQRTTVRSSGIPALSWRQCADELLALLPLCDAPSR